MEVSFQMRSVRTGKISLLAQSKRDGLTIFSEMDSLLKALETHQILILKADTGTGKSTQFPQALLEEMGRELRRKSQRIGFTQPRRITTKQLTERIKKEMNLSGREVAYKIRFDDTTDKKTLLKVMTDGMLVAELGGDPELKEYGFLIIDEIHQRNRYTDLIMAFLKSRILSARPDLRVIFLSATPDMTVKAYFEEHGFSVFYKHVDGKRHPLTIEYLREPSSKLKYDILDRVMAIHHAKLPGNILVFVPGIRDIKLLQELIGQAMEESLTAGHSEEPFEIHGLHSGLSPQEQVEICETRSSNRKVVIATEIAETGVTVVGVRFVLDTGLVNQPSFDPITGITALIRTNISRAAARQRAGRAGREGPGTVYRLYTEEDYKKMQPHTPAGVVIEEPTELIFQLLRLKVINVLGFCKGFLEPPNEGSLVRGMNRLFQLGLLQGIDGKLTEIGENVLRFSQLSHRAAVAIGHGLKHPEVLVPLAILISILEAENIFLDNEANHDYLRQHNDDLLAVLRLFVLYRQEGNKIVANNRLSVRAMEGVDRSFQQLCRELKIGHQIASFDFNTVKACLVKGYIHRVYCIVDNRNPKYCNIFEQYPNGVLSSDSGVSGKEKWILAARAVILEKFTLLSLASPVSENMVLSSVDKACVPRHQVAAALFTEQRSPNKFARVKFDFQGSPSEGVLSLRKDEIIEVLSWNYMDDKNYGVARLRGGQEGLFPVACCQPMEHDFKPEEDESV